MVIATIEETYEQITVTYTSSQHGHYFEHGFSFCLSCTYQTIALISFIIIRIS